MSSAEIVYTLFMVGIIILSSPLLVGFINSKKK